MLYMIKHYYVKCTFRFVGLFLFLFSRVSMISPPWSSGNLQVEDWHVMAGPLIDKLFSEPSNAVIVRFLSHISEYLAEAVDVVFNRLILYVREQKE